MTRATLLIFLTCFESIFVGSLLTLEWREDMWGGDW